jgi:tetratricopeptide (TPR) repeat protein
MTSSTRRLNILFIAAFSTLLPALSQERDTVIAFADHAYGTGNYTLAIKEYQRALFFHLPDDEARIFEHLGHSYYSLGQYDKAIEYYDRAVSTYHEDSARYRCLFRKIFSLVMNSQYQYALIELFSINDSLPESLYREYQFYLGVCYFQLEDFEKARDAFLLSTHGNDTTSIDQIRTLFANKKALERPNPHTAYTMSLFFPGAGQFYAGDLRNGINSLILNGLLAFLFINTAINYSIWDAFFTVFPWFQRYYQGGFTRAENIARHRRDEKRQKVYREILSVVKNSR